MWNKLEKTVMFLFFLLYGLSILMVFKITKYVYERDSKYLELIDPEFDQLVGNGDSWINDELADASEYTKLYVYNREIGTNYTELIFGNLTSIEVSGFNVSKSTKVLIHGWLDNAFINFAPALRQAYMANQDVNVVVVDWPKVAKEMYPLARLAVTPMGKFLARFLDWLVTEGSVSVDSVHVIGHSLGAHIGGVMGEYCTVGKLRRITGLDPAGPLFGKSNKGRLDSSDAQFVDVIHTCGGYLGCMNAVAHADFYPNKGQYNQPGCHFDLGKCSHIRSYELFVESVSSKAFVAKQCNQWKNYKKDLCDDGPAVVMGEHVDPSIRGTFYLHTAGSAPYGIGNQTACEQEHK